MNLEYKIKPRRITFGNHTRFVVMQREIPNGLFGRIFNRWHSIGVGISLEKAQKKIKKLRKKGNL